MKPVYPRHIMRHFTPVSFRLEKTDRIACLLNIAGEKPAEDKQPQSVHRRCLDRRCGIDRRTRQHPVLMDTRSPHARRKQRQRRWEDDPELEQHHIGIDVYS